MNEFSILHLSDLHIGKNSDNPKTIAKKIGETLRSNRIRINVVVFTGDIVDQSDEQQKMDAYAKKDQIIDEANSFFNQLLDDINDIRVNDPLKREDFLFVAGNHDIYRDIETDKEKYKEYESYNPWTLYKDFLTKFYEGDIPKYYKDGHMLIKSYDQNQILFLGFDSNEYEKAEKKFTPHINSEQFELADKFVKNEYLEYYKVAFFHHPCTLFEENSGNDTHGIINNALEVCNKLTEWNVNLVLHGHKHWARQSIYRPFENQKIYILAANSIGLKDKQDYSGNIIQIIEKQLYLKKIIANNLRDFKIQPMDIYDNYANGLLFDVIKAPINNASHAFDTVLEMINKLYLSYEQLNILQYVDSNYYVFKNSIGLGLDDNYCEEKLDNNLTSNEWSIIKQIIKTKEISKEIRDEVQNNLKKKRHVAYALLAVFFTNVHKVISEMNVVEISRTEFNTGNGCYYVYLQLKGNENEHEHEVRDSLGEKVEKLQDQLDTLQDYLACIKLEIKNIFLELLDQGTKNIRHYNFDASVPRLIKLLTGTNIYNSDFAFARELIQNSIDAVSFRETQNKNENYNRTINIKMDRDDQGRKYFEIRDFGIGMKRETIDRYLTTLGRSYYNEYIKQNEKHIKYNSVSNFGIGFLSVFKMCKKIVIKTKHFKEDIYHELEINSEHGHFSIYSNSNSDFSAGTDIVCYFKSDQSINYEEIVNYIRSIMLDIKYDVAIEVGGIAKPPIKARMVRKQGIENAIFVPFDEDRHEVGHINYDNGILTEKDIKKYRHGILIRPNLLNQEDDGVNVLSAGILLHNTRLKDIFGNRVKDLKLQYMKVTMNFPPNWLEIDVSREKVNGLQEAYILGGIEQLKSDILEELKNQLKKISNRSNITLAFVSDILKFIKCFGGEAEEGLNILYLNTQFKEKRISFSIKHNLQNLCGNWFLKRTYSYAGPSIDSDRSIHKSLVDLFHEGLSFDEVSTILHMTESEECFRKCKSILSGLGLKVEEFTNKNLPIVLAACLPEEGNFGDTDEEDSKLQELIRENILKSCVVQDFVKCELFSCDYNDRDQTKIVMDSENLQKIINDIASHHYGAPKDIEKYKFIWEYIIMKEYNKCDFHFKVGINNIEGDVLKSYKKLNNKTKRLYISDSINSRIDIFTIASCYMGALISESQKRTEWEEDKDSPEKYSWILNVGLDLLYMWKLSKYYKDKSKVNKYNKLKKQKEMMLPVGKLKKYLQLLALQEKKFDVLEFAELLQWIDFYNEEHFLSGC